jgi:hypothetical protein
MAARKKAAKKGNPPRNAGIKRYLKKVALEGLMQIPKENGVLFSPAGGIWKLVYGFAPSNAFYGSLANR